MGLSLVVSSSVDVDVDSDARPMDMDRSFVVSFLFLSQNLEKKERSGRSIKAIGPP